MGLRVLLSAYSCEPGRGSEGEIGWRLVLRLARCHDVWVITRENLRSTHEALFVDSPRPKRLHFIYLDLPKSFRFYKRGKRGFLIYYYIWGPVGSENTHPEMRHQLSFGSRNWDRIRRVARWCMRNLDPFVRLTGARADLILTHTIDTIPRRYLKKARPFVQTGIEDVPALARPKDDFARGKELRLVFAGELKDWKGARFALDAALRYFAQDQMARLTIVGDGPLRDEMEAIAQRNGEGHRVSFLGTVPMEKLVQILHESDVFLYPSFHHGLATVVLQAMLTGLPVVCIEGDAIGRAVGQKAGITIPPGRGRDPVAEFARAIAYLAANEANRQVLAKQAQALSRERYSYGVLANAISMVYADVLSTQMPRSAAR